METSDETEHGEVDIVKDNGLRNTDDEKNEEPDDVSDVVPQDMPVSHDLNKFEASGLGINPDHIFEHALNNNGNNNLSLILCPQKYIILFSFILEKNVHKMLYTCIW